MLGTFVILFTSLWLICGVWAAVISFTYFQLVFPLIADKDRKEDHKNAMFFFFLGPLSLLVLGEERKKIKTMKQQRGY